MSVEEHKKYTPASVNAAVITISTSRNEESDESGRLIRSCLEENNHCVLDYGIVPDETMIICKKITRLLEHREIEAIITTGGTGLGRKDVTIQAVRPVFEKELISFNALFVKLSYEAVGSASLLSMATAGVAGKKIIFCLPGSPQACRLAMEKLILPEIGHIMKHIYES